MKSILNPAILALFVLAIGQTAFAQDTIFVTQPQATQAAPEAVPQADAQVEPQAAPQQPAYQAVPQAEAQPVYQAVPQSAAPQPIYQTSQQPAYQAVPQATPQPVYQAVPQPTPQPLPPQPKTNERRNSFYLNGSLGLDIPYIYYNHRYYDFRSKYEGIGIGYIAEFTLGFLVRELIAGHVSFGFASFDGKYDIIEMQHADADTEIDGKILTLAPGLTAFPFSRAENFLQGTFIGAKLVYGIIVLNMPGYKTTEDLKSYFTVGLSLEIGKDWHISDRANIGVALRWQFDNICSGDEETDDYHHEHDMNSVQLLFRINRR